MVDWPPAPGQNIMWWGMFHLMVARNHTARKRLRDSGQGDLQSCPLSLWLFPPSRPNLQNFLETSKITLLARDQTFNKCLWGTVHNSKHNIQPLIPKDSWLPHNATYVQSISKSPKVLTVPTLFSSPSRKSSDTQGKFLGVSYCKSQKELAYFQDGIAQSRHLHSKKEE
jgi:hypothetical protein